MQIHDQLDTIIAKALELHERGVEVPAIIARFPRHADLVRETLRDAETLVHACTRITPPPQVLSRIIARLPATEERRRFSWMTVGMRPMLRFGLPALTLAAVVLVVLIRSTPEVAPTFFKETPPAILETAPVSMESGIGRESADAPAAPPSLQQPAPLESLGPPVGSVDGIVNAALVDISNESAAFNQELTQASFAVPAAAVMSDSAQFFNEYAF
ncbi:MAG: hypothetical protein AAB601_00515 [Patescibacteria group bacterium]